MNASGRFARLGLGAIVVVLFLFPTMIATHSASGQGSDLPSTPFRTRARTEPISQRRITMQLRFDDGQVAKATQLEGGMIRVASKKDGLVLGLTPVISDDGQVQVKLFKIDPITHQDKSLGESLHQIETFAINEQESTISYGVFSITLKLTSLDSSGTQEKKTL